MADEPIARGVLLTLPVKHKDALDALRRESRSILRALRVEAAPSESATPEADFFAILVEPGSDPAAIAFPDLKDRAATVIGVGESAADTRVAIAALRKRLRAHGATLGPHELALSPADFGYLGLESDGLRERLQILLTTLTHDAERLRLRREGWEEPDA